MNVYVMGGHRYLFDSDRQCLVLAKGQMSLFDEQQHPRDEGGKFAAKERMVAKLKAAEPKFVEHFNERAKKVHAKIQSMSPRELEDYDAEVDLHDEHWLATIEQIKKHLKKGEKPEDHAHIDQILDEIDDHALELSAAHAAHAQALLQAQESRIDDCDC